MDDNVTTSEERNQQDGGTNGEAIELSLEQKLTAAEAKAAEYLEGWQRERAEFVNARKRLERERGEAYLRANLEAVKKLLPMLDDFERALDRVPENIAADPWFEGIQLVQRKLQMLLESMNVVRIEAVGQPFDPNFHEALSLQPSEEYDSGTVIEELQPGYKVADRVIRAALVNVAE
jgi:molecular chaperone GrpE